MNSPSRTVISLATIAATIVVGAGLSGCGRALQSNQREVVSSRPPVNGLIPPAPSRSLSGPAASGQKGDYQELNESSPGEPVDINGSLVSGKRTIVEFYSPYCGPCMALRPYVQRLAGQRSDLAIRSINVNRPQVEGIDWHSPVIQENPQVKMLPYFLIYGPDKRLEADGVRASNAVVDCIQEQMRRPR
jgi:thiol-disulfide isomerase/thioredoxin